MSISTGTIVVHDVIKGTGQGVVMWELLVNGQENQAK